MNIVLATPLYPPDIEEPAPYTKELARRFSVQGHKITVVTYGRIPERVPGVQVVITNKRRPLPFRLVAYTRALWHAAHQADVVYAQNGASVELPLVFISLFIRKPIVLHIGDTRALEQAQKKPSLRFIHHLACNRSKTIFTETPISRPEVLPFGAPPTQEERAYQSSWDTHIEKLTRTFTYA